MSLPVSLPPHDIPSSFVHSGPSSCITSYVTLLIEVLVQFESLPICFYKCSYYFNKL